MNRPAGRGLEHARIGEDWRGLARMDGKVAKYMKGIHAVQERVKAIVKKCVTKRRHQVQGINPSVFSNTVVLSLRANEPNLTSPAVSYQH